MYEQVPFNGSTFDVDAVTDDGIQVISSRIGKTTARYRCPENFRHSLKSEYTQLF